MLFGRIVGTAALGCQPRPAPLRFSPIPGFILSAPFFRRSEGSRVSERAVKFRARSLAPLVKTRGLRDDAVEVEQGWLRTLNQINRILQANALKLVQTRRS